jgi:hypothetical protein
MFVGLKCKVTGNVVTGNFADSFGAGICISGGDPEVSQTIRI